jgi:hypothetical protein
VKEFGRFVRCFGRVLIEKTYYYCRFCIALLVGLIQEDLTVFERVKIKPFVIVSGVYFM